MKIYKLSAILPTPSHCRSTQPIKHSGFGSQSLAPWVTLTQLMDPSQPGWLLTRGNLTFKTSPQM